MRSLACIFLDGRPKLTVGEQTAQENMADREWAAMPMSYSKKLLDSLNQKLDGTSVMKLTLSVICILTIIIGQYRCLETNGTSSLLPDAMPTVAAYRKKFNCHREAAKVSVIPA